MAALSQYPARCVRVDGVLEAAFLKGDGAWNKWLRGLAYQGHGQAAYSAGKMGALTEIVTSVGIEQTVWEYCRRSEIDKATGRERDVMR